ncbi:MAG: branched-chain amino acid ABC transporter permease [Nitrososphaerota archaeon]|nr:branched-chain amino acid ABC transporter permease [Aigarchaeota archaeon]MDW8076997.1 branched-chain amino acid ABC transporter permease [Nitrososphaerota archaeon]
MALPIPLTFLIDLLTFFGIFAIISMSLNLEFGYAGIPNFGKLLAVAGGAFFVGAIPGRVIAYLFNLPAEFDFITNNLEVVSSINQILMFEPVTSIFYLLVSLIGAALSGAALGYIASYPGIRLRGDYLAMTLLAMAEVFRIVGDNWEPFVGGSLGVRIPDPFRWVGGEYRPLYVALTILLVTAAIFIYLELVSRSPLGRTLRAIRDDELSARVYGKDVDRLRIKTLIVGCAIAAIGGALYSFLTASVSARDFNRVTHTFWPWVMVIVGGAGNNLGALIGAGIFVTLRRLITFYKSYFETIVPFDVVWLEYMLLGLALILVLLYRPEGLVPERPTKTLKHSYIVKLISRIKSNEGA